MDSIERAEMLEQLLNWIDLNQVGAVLVAIVVFFVFIFSLKSASTKIFASNRGVSAGRDINAPVMTGDIGTNSTSILSALASIATILGLLVGAATLYVSYLALVKAG